MHGLVMEERMRKVVSVVLCICMLTVMAGCGSEGEKKETAGPSGSLQTPEASEPSAVAPDNPESGEDPDVSQEAYDDSRIIEAVHEELETDQGTIVFCIPNLEDDSPDAEAVNADINDWLAESIREEMEYFSEYGYTEMSGVSWESHWTGSILSLVIRAGYYGAGDFYRVYHYDFAQDRRLDNRDILSMLSVDAEELERAAKHTVAGVFDEQYDDIEWCLDGEGGIERSNIDAYYQYLLMERCNSLAEVTVDNLMIYPADGNWNMIVKLYIPAGCGEIYMPHEILFDTPDGTVTVSEGGITAKLENNEITVCFTDSEDIRGYLENDVILTPGYEIQYGHEYTIAGTYSNYKGIGLYSLGLDCYPMLFMVTEEGRLEFADVLRQVQGGYFAASPIPYISGVTELRAEVVESLYEYEYPTLMFCVDGEWYDILDWGIMSISSLEELICTDCTWNCSMVDTNGDSHEITWDLTEYLDCFGSFKLYDLNMVTGEILEVEGSLSYLGATDEGVIFDFLLWSSDGMSNSYEGTLVLFRQEFDYDYMSVRVLSGYDLFGDADEPVNLVRGVG